MVTIKPGERTAILDALKAGVVPRVGLQHIQAGRSREIKVLAADLQAIKEGTSKIRFIVGEYGSGKSFFLTLAALMAREQNFVTTRLDITTEKVLYSREHKARRFYCELVKNLANRTRPGGGALGQIVESWISQNLQEGTPLEAAEKMGGMLDFAGGQDFIALIQRYAAAFREGNRLLMDCCLKWLSGEYESKHDAYRELGIRSIIGDENYFDYLKILTRFFIAAGYRGFVLCVDELAVLTRLSSQARTRNYETILKMYNHCLQGELTGVYYLLGGTPEFLQHPTRGLYSYGALKTRLSSNPFQDDEHPDLLGPVLALPNLTPEELYAVFVNIRNVFACYDPAAFLLDDEGIEGFLQWAYNRLGAKVYLSPREAVKNYVFLLSQLEQFPGKSWQDFLGCSDQRVEQEAPAPGAYGLTPLAGLRI